ncbi:DUF4157 domain-containing protein [Moorena sp. SIO4G3]|uniref:eCIS core domain-containing protein n=1 Tax=Moorena sp. SIO4G3 TaxID=2607821 RepID=UPI0025FC74B8|nr:DUF4157 domain-containing protein [Moorena sp. SIO4G3]
MDELQGIIGNRALGHLIKSQPHQYGEVHRSQEPLLSSVSPIRGQPIQRMPRFRGLSHELRGNWSEGNLVQAKLTIGEAGDKYELEADRVASEDLDRINAPIPNKTGLPDKLKAGVENLSGYSLDDVRVHYNSPKPAQLQALAYTQGTDIHVASGQEKHLPHEAWHVVQQMQGRVKPTMQMKGLEINDDVGLEREADVMGEKATQPLQRKSHLKSPTILRRQAIQCIGDKMAVTYEDVSKMGEEIKKLRTEIENIYQKHKLQKKETRNKLDEDFLEETNIKAKQDYIIYAIKYLYYTKYDEDQKKAKKNKKDLEKLDKKYGFKENMFPIAEKNLDQVITAIQKDTRAKDPKEYPTVVNNYATQYGRHLVSDPIVQGYELKYKDSAMKRKNLITEWNQIALKHQYNLYVVTSNNIGKIIVNPENDIDQEAHIATIYFNDQRFEKALMKDVVIKNHSGGQETREVYSHRESGREYVKDAFDVPVKRYVKRALNKYDNPSEEEGIAIKADPRTKKDTKKLWKEIGEDIPSMSKEDKYQEIRNHQRAKEAQGGSPFISFTTTDHPIFGSSAKLFEDKKTGVATVDLAKISKSRIFDTHTSKAMESIHSIPDPDPKMKFIENSDEVERNSAARDAMRTREVVVAGSIPEDAIIAVRAEGVDYIKKEDDGRFYKPRK